MGCAVEEIKLEERGGGPTKQDLLDRAKYNDYNPLDELPYKIRMENRREEALAVKPEGISKEAWLRRKEQEKSRKRIIENKRLFEEKMKKMVR